MPAPGPFSPDNVHAIAMLGVLFAQGLLAAWARRSRPPVAPRLRWFIAVAVIFTALCSGALTLHMCNRGDPITQTLAPLGLTVVGVALAGTRRAALGLAVFGVLCGFTLSVWYTGMVHAPDLTGNPRPCHGGAQAAWHTPLTRLFRVDPPGICDVVAPALPGLWEPALGGASAPSGELQ